MKSLFKKIRWACWEGIAKLAARSYVAGPELADVLQVCRRLAASQVATTICYWNREEEPPQKIVAAYIGALNALVKEKLDSYLSIKSPAFGFDQSLMIPLLERAKQESIRLHFDSHAPEVADKTFELMTQSLPYHANLSCTLPGRWRRSLTDAEWAIQRQLPVRVVKGQWADTVKPDLDLRAGFLSVIDKLAGRARHVAVATHDPVLAEEAFKRLLKTKTSCELELLYGLPLKAARRVAQNAGVRFRMYIPYGHGWLPYSIYQMVEHPGMLWWMLRDLCGGRDRL